MAGNNRILDVVQNENDENVSLELSIASKSPQYEKEIPEAKPRTSMSAEVPTPRVSAYGEMEKNLSVDNSEARAKAIYIKATEHIRNGQVLQAREKLISLVDTYPDYYAGRTLLAQKLVEWGQFGQAEQVLHQGLSIDHKNAEWANLYARLLVNRGDLQGAVNRLESALPNIDRMPEFYAFLAALYQKTNRHEDAISVYRDVLGVKPNNNVWWMGLAISLEAVNLQQEALHAYRQALKGNSLSLDLQKYITGKINHLARQG